MRLTRTIGIILAAALLAATLAAAQTPNRIDVVQRVAANEGKAALQACKSTDHDANCGQFTRLVACALSADGFGLLTKGSGENQWDGYAVDAIIYKPANQVIDLISGGLGLQWIEQPRRNGNNWAPAVGCGSVEPPPPPPPPGDAVTHAELKAVFDEISARLGKLEAGTPGGGTSGPGADAVAVDQLATSKAILELLKKTAFRFGVQ